MFLLHIRINRQFSVSLLHLCQVSIHVFLGIVFIMISFTQMLIFNLLIVLLMEASVIIIIERFACAHLVSPINQSDECGLAFRISSIYLQISVISIGAMLLL